jgi:hypothetical protein
MRDNEAAAKRRRATPGTLDHACALWATAADKRGLPDPLRVFMRCGERIRDREPLVERLTPELARTLARAGEKVRPDLLVVSGDVSLAEFERRRRALVKRLPRRRRLMENADEAELNLALLYLRELEGRRPAELLALVHRAPARLRGRGGRAAYKATVDEVRSRIASAWLVVGDLSR